MKSKLWSLLWLVGILLLMVQPTLARNASLPDAASTPQISASTPLEELTNRGDVSINVTGDGTTTSSVRLDLDNNTNRMVNLTIPSGQVFSPSDPTKRQYMMTVSDTAASIPAGGHTTIAALPTVCISSKSTPPPGQDDIYTVGGYPNQQFLGTLRKIVQTAHAKDEAGQFDAVPISEARRANTIAQLAIWMTQADITNKPEDAVSKQTIAKAILDANKSSSGDLTSTQQKQFNEGVNQIFAAADLTRKQCLSPVPSNVIEIGDNQAPAQNAGQARQPETTTGDHGEQITTTFHPDGSVFTRTTVHQPTAGGDPRDPTSETHVTEITTYAQGERLPHTRTTVTEVHTLRANGEKEPKTRTTVRREWSRDSNGRRYVSTRTEVNEDCGLTRTTTTQTYSSADDETAEETTTRDRYDPNVDGWVPAPLQSAHK
jgi:hypothetical protein